MVHFQFKLHFFAGQEKENFGEFEQILRSFLAVTENAANKQAKFLHLNIPDATLSYFIFCILLPIRFWNFQ